jgi:multiple sugar transport system substrate-binding protein
VAQLGTRTQAAALVGLAVGLTASATIAAAQEFDWRAHEGATVTFLSSNHPWANAVLARGSEFTELTGIEIRHDTFQEAQMRQRLVTILQAQNADVDVFMSLKSREGLQYARAGWYTDLAPFVNDPAKTAPGYNLDDFSPALVEGEQFDGELTGIPLNIEGPVLYVRRDILEECSVEPPATLTALGEAAAKLKECKPDLTPFVTRGAKGAIAYTFSNFLHNLGGNYFSENGKSNLCSETGRAALELYAGLLRDYGPPGVTNYSFLQIRELYGQGRAVMAFESSNEFGPITEFDGRLEDTSVMLLPAGEEDRPTVIGWGLSMSAFSGNQDATWTFMQWATSPEMQTALALEGIAPPRASVTTSPEYKDWLGEHRVREEWQAALESMSATGTSEVGPPIAAQPEARDILGEAVQRLILGQTDVAGACAEADEGINALIEREQRG